MTEQDLIDLGFTKEVDPGVQCSDQDGNEWIEDEYHYYVYDLVIGLGFLSCASVDVRLEARGKGTRQQAVS
jgi:hypothetical protein